jgi:hypothetical protein
VPTDVEAKSEDQRRRSERHLNKEPGESEKRKTKRDLLAIHLSPGSDQARQAMALPTQKTGQAMPCEDTEHTDIRKD